MSEILTNDIGYLKKVWQIIRKKAPFSNLLKNNNISSEDIEISVNDSLEKELVSNIDSFFQNVSPFFKITWKVRESIDKNFKSTLWEEFSSEFISEIFLILDSKKNKEKIKKIEFTEEKEDRDFLLWELIRDIRKDKNFKEVIKKFYNNDDSFLEKMSKIKNIYLNISENKKLDFNILWNSDFSSVWSVVGKISIHEYLFIWLIFWLTAVWDIDSVVRFKAPQADIASDWIWKVNLIVDNVNSWLIWYWDVLAWISPALIDSSAKIAFVSAVAYAATSTKKETLKKSLLLWISWFAMVASIWVAWWLQWISWAISEMANEQKVKLFDSWVNSGSNSDINLDADSNNVLINTKNINKNTSNLYLENKEVSLENKTVLDTSLEFLDVFYEAFRIVNFSWWNVVDNFDEEKVLSDFIWKLKTWALDHSWWFEKMDSYNSQIDEIWDLDDVYKEMFQEVLRDLNWWSSNWIALFWPSSYEKISILFQFSWYDKKWNTFNRQLDAFVKGVYWNGSEEWKEILHNIHNKINENPSFVPYKVQSSSKDSWEDIKNEFIYKNKLIISSIKKEIKDFFINIEDQWIEDTKVSDLNKKFNKFNQFIDWDLRLNIKDYLNGVNIVTSKIQDRFRDIDKKYENPGVYYDDVHLNGKNLNTDIKLNLISEEYITSDDVLNELKDWINHFLETWEISDVLYNSSAKLEQSILLNFADITYILLFIWLRFLRWRKVSWWKKMSFKEIKISSDNEMANYKESIDSVVMSIQNIFQDKIWGLKNLKIDNYRLSEIIEFVDKFWISVTSWWDSALFKKETNSIEDDIDFMWWKMNQISNVYDLKMYPDKFSDIWENDSIFVSQLQEVWSIDSIWIIENQNWSFNIISDCTDWKCLNKLDLKSFDFTEILKKTWFMETWVDYFWSKVYNLWIIIRKNWFTLMPYDENWKINILLKDDLNKYIINN
jgi:hypothetical protein